MDFCTTFYKLWNSVQLLRFFSLASLSQRKHYLGFAIIGYLQAWIRNKTSNFVLTAILHRTTAFFVPVLTFIYFSLNYSSCSCKKAYEAEWCVLNELICSCSQELLALLSLKHLHCPALRRGETAAWLEILKCQAHASFFIAALYFPLISLGSGTRAGQGTWPSISHMHSRRWYFLGPKVAGCDSFFLSLSSFSSISLEKRFVTIRSLNCNTSSPFPGPRLSENEFTVPTLWTLPCLCQFCLGKVLFPSAFHRSLYHVC